MSLRRVMKNIYLTANKLQKFKGDNKKLPKWWTSEKNYSDYNKEKK